MTSSPALCRAGGQVSRWNNTSNNNNATWQSRGRGIRRTKEKKAKLTCEHCRAPGHEISECFKLHGYPNWFKDLKEQRRRNSANLVVENAGLRDDVAHTQPGKDLNSPCDMATLIQQEIAKYMANSGGNDKAGGSAVNMNYAHFVDYAGKGKDHDSYCALCTFVESSKHHWIIDTGASKHMCSNERLLQFATVHTKTTIYLPMALVNLSPTQEKHISLVLWFLMMCYLFLHSLTTFILLLSSLNLLTLNSLSFQLIVCYRT
ncbi:hypothetical protein DH2020_044386 [Rehmannia glutinosa]|uniref:Uncharacterized protein n=1 Tax=Rehmannia glutinosa TaxID=99300 RepID=A0ABR0UIN3_REHGL